MVAHSEMSYMENTASVTNTETEYNEANLTWRKSTKENGSTQSAQPNDIQKSPETSCLQIKQNGSIVLELGQYKATIIPILVLLLCKGCGSMFLQDFKPDPRVSHLPLMGSEIPIMLLCLAYIFFSLVWGPRVMEHREPLKLRKSMMLYNIIQVVLCSYMFVEVGLVGWFSDYNFKCQPCDFSNSEKAVRMTRVAYLFSLSKLLDFTDTVFFVLNKKFSHISLLHVVHHSVMAYSMTTGTRFIAGGHGTFMGYINSAVHVLMYAYYLLAAMGPAVRPYLWWKKYLTTIQLVQFVAVFLHSAQLFVVDCPNVPKGIAVWTCIYAVIFFGLFMDFYNKAYNQKGKTQKKEVAPKPLKRKSILSSPTSKLAFTLDNLTCMSEKQS